MKRRPSYKNITGRFIVPLSLQTPRRPSYVRAIHSLPFICLFISLSPSLQPILCSGPAGKKKQPSFIHHTLGKGLGPNVLGGRVAAATADCRKVGRRIEILVVQLQRETLYGSRENFSVPTPCRSPPCSQAWCVTVFNGPVNVGTVSTAQSQSRTERRGGRRADLIYNHVNVGDRLFSLGSDGWHPSIFSCTAPHHAIARRADTHTHTEEDITEIKGVSTCPKTKL